MQSSGDSQIKEQASWLSRFKETIGPLFAWWPEYKKSKMGVAGIVIVVIMVMAILLAPVLATHDPYEYSADLSGTWLPPSFSHLLGTNSVGQDIWSSLLYAGRISLAIGVIAAIGATLIGTILGVIAGYFGGLADEIITRISDVLLILPRIPLYIIIAFLVGPGFWTIIMVVVSLGWTRNARQVRAQTLSCKQYQFVERSRSQGASNIHIMWNHILPNVAGLVIANFVLEVVTVIMLEAGLSFLGLGDPLHKSWGVMLHFAQIDGSFSHNAWWWWLPPGICIALIGTAFSFIGNTLNDRFVLRLGKRSSA